MAAPGGPSPEVDSESFWAELREFLPAAIYFWVYWPLKAYGRRLLHIGALAYLSASFMFLAAELWLELWGREEIVVLIRSMKTPLRVYALQAGLLMATVLIFFHHLHELRHRRTEHILGDSLWTLLEGRGKPDELGCITFSLPLVYRAFSKFGVRAVSIWQPAADGMHVAAGWSYPADIGETLISLPSGEGIASAVFKDKRVHYVPRMGLPFNSGPLVRFSWRFPHALILTVKWSAHALPEVMANKILRGKVFLKDTWKTDKCRAFLVVPLSTFPGQQLGVMSVDFERTDPIGKEQMKTAVSLATVIGEELLRIRNGVGAHPSQTSAMR